VSGTHSSHLPVEDLERWARQLSLEPGSVLQLVCHDRDDMPWTYLLLSMDFAGNRCTLLRLDEGELRNARSRAGSHNNEDLQDLLDDLSSSKEGIHWRKL